jgi:hypothetical protein
LERPEQIAAIGSSSQQERDYGREACIDFEHESDIETVRNSSADEWLKQTVIGRLQERHQERQAPYLQHLERLEKQILTRAA